jgi:hypothetical protein
MPSEILRKEFSARARRSLDTVFVAYLQLAAPNSLPHFWNRAAVKFSLALGCAPENLVVYGGLAVRVAAHDLCRGSKD